MSRHFDDLDAVLEFDALDDFGQLIFALQSSPRFRSGIDQFEYATMSQRSSLKQSAHFVRQALTAYTSHGNCRDRSWTIFQGSEVHLCTCSGNSLPFRLGCNQTIGASS